MKNVGVVDNWKFIRNINKKKKSDVLQAYVCDKCYKREYGKHDFACCSIFLWLGSK